MKDALSYQVLQLLRGNQITIDSDELTFQIQSHPTYPSLHAITGVLDHFHIENLALDIPKTSKTLDQLPQAFIAQLETKSQKEFAVVTKTTKGYRLTYDRNTKVKLSEAEFLDLFTGIILVVDKGAETEKTNPTDITSKITKGLFIGSILIGIILLVLNIPDISTILFVTISVLGIYMSHTIVMQEQGKTSILGQAFCSANTEKKNCNAVLSSKGAALIKGLKLSDLSFIYFTSLTLVSFILLISKQNIQVPKLISVIVLPISIYSIIYQAIIIKKWCILCLTIVTLMWLQATIAFINFNPILEPNTTLIALGTFLAIGALWLNSSKTNKDNRILKLTKLEYFKFRRNFELFQSQLVKSKTLSTAIDFGNTIRFGNPESKLELSIITNPLCGHCKEVHKIAEQILHQYQDDVNLNIIFNVNVLNLDNNAVKITSRLLEIYHIEGEISCLKAMQDIYGDVTPQNWLDKWENTSTSNNYIINLQNQYDWCAKNSINFTPEILINGKSYPSIFNRKDLLFYMETLATQSSLDDILQEPKNI